MSLPEPDVSMAITKSRKRTMPALPEALREMAPDAFLGVWE